MHLQEIKYFIKRIPSCESCAYFIKNKNPLMGKCKFFEYENGKNALVIYCRLDERLCGLQGTFYKRNI